MNLVLSGIYKITCLKNNKFYIGSAIHFFRRWERHLKDLTFKRHQNLYFQRIFDKYGIESFEFSIIQVVNSTEKEILHFYEQYYLNIFFLDKNIINIGKNATGGDNLTNNPNRLQIIEKIRKTNKIINSKLTKEERSKKYGKIGKLNGNWKNGGQSFKNCKCGKKISKRYKTCSTCRDRSGKNNPFYGHFHSQERKEKQSIYAKERRLKGILPGNARKVFIENILYDCIAAAAKALNVCNATILYRIKSKNIKFKNYKYYE